MGSVLVAPIGDHPVIVTAAADALARAGVAIAEVHILCPSEEMIKLGAEWAQEELLDGCDNIQIHDLPLIDANSESAAREYLQMLAYVLKRCEDNNDEVHLLLAGGRKNMSALTGLVAQFFPCVKKMYHLLDKHEKDPLRRNFFSIEELTEWPDEKRQDRMHPRAEDVIFFEVPSPTVLTDATQLRRAFADLSQGKLPTVTNSAAVDAFWSTVFGTKPPEPALTLWVSEHAVKDYEGLNEAIREYFARCFEKMTTHQLLDVHQHGKFENDKFKIDCECFNANANPARPFYYRDRERNRVILCRLVYHPGTYDRLINSNESVLRNDHPAYKPLFEIMPKRSAILFASLGDTPMIASQAYMLLRRQANVEAVVLVYPEANPEISQNAHTLYRDFQREGVTCELQPILGLSDANSTQACQDYLKNVVQIIANLQKQHSTTEIHLLLSGGRKSMATLNLLAAQRTGLSLVWHTLVKDHKLEQRLEEELRQAPSPTKRRDILFLRRYSPEDFDLFAVPVFPIA